jgi:hypothetical protein
MPTDLKKTDVFDNENQHPNYYTQTSAFAGNENRQLTWYSAARKRFSEKVVVASKLTSAVK